VLKGSVTALRQIELISTAARKAHRLAVNHDAHLPGLASTVFSHVPAQLACGNAAQLGEVRQYLLRHLTRVELARAATLLATLQEKLAGTSGPISEEIRRFSETQLGNSALHAERVVARYAELVSEIRRIENLAFSIDTLNTLAKTLESGVCQRSCRVSHLSQAAIATMTLSGLSIT
jgi:hypothetical protein